MMKHNNFFESVPKGMKSLLDQEQYFTTTSIKPITRELIKMRVSQINDCAYCLNMHAIDALKLGESNQRIFLLNAWEETEIFNEEGKIR